MKIKSLEIHGFKSFVDRVRFAFPTGTSAIVGPNGCGKSNVVDAIRWVLGEHNARHLRGAHMEDLIFNGSDNRKPLGMAEVTMTLSNESGLAPARYAEFGEIEVKRRLFRSGDSEYFINKVPSRLKDVVELFTDTGVGTSAYSIIEQGQVGWLVNAKPAERRVIFEEAAGINKYKQKKEASIRRLEATKENLTRVNDIISEVKRQLGSLDRQARKAERYKKLKTELKALDLHLASAECVSLTNAKLDASKRLETLKDEELALGADIDGTEGRLSVIRVDYLAAEKDFQEVRERALEVERRVQAEERTGELLRLRSEELDRNDARLATEVAELESAVAALGDETTRLRETLASMSAELERLAAELTIAEAEVASITALMLEKTGALKAEEASLAMNAAKMADVRYSIELAIKEEKTLRESDAKAGSELAQLDAELALGIAPLEELRRLLLESTGRKGDLAGRMSAIAERLSRTEAEVVSKESELKTNKEEAAAVGARLAALEEMERQYEGIGEGVKAVMESSRAGGQGGVRGLLADAIEPQAGFERAVEAVLGLKLQYVMVESRQAGIDAIGFLRTSGRGRGSFLPLGDQATGSSNGFAEKLKAAGLEPLIDRVTIKDGYRDAISYLLADAAIVPDLDAAARLWQQHGTAATFVTPEGDMLDSHGVLTGGTAGSGGVESGLLTKKREMSAARERLSTLSSAIGALEAEITRLADEARRARAEHEEARETLHRETIGEVSITGELAKRELETERLTQRKSALTSERAVISSETEKVLAKKASLSIEREALEKAVLDGEGRIGGQKDELAALAVGKEEVGRRVTEAKVAHASMRERHGSITAAIGEKERQRSETLARIDSKKAEAAAGRVEKEEAGRRIEAVRDAVSRLLAEKDGIKAIEIEKQQQLSEHTERINALDEELKAKRKTLTDLQRRKGEASIELMEHDIALKNLIERVTEKYGVEISSYAPAPEETETLNTVEGGPDAYAGRAAELREKITSLGEVSLAALDEYKELDERHNFLVAQKADLEKSVEELFEAITRINRTTRERFKKTFEEIDQKFRETFPKFFNGGRAELRLTDETDVLEAGVEIVAQPPGKKLQNIMLLSGGEKALTATAFIFSVFLIKPSPFCLLDEVDAPLDDANVERFNGFVKEMSKMSQFILITHNKRTMEVADTLYGVTMEEPGVSKTVSVEF